MKKLDQLKKEVEDAERFTAELRELYFQALDKEKAKMNVGQIIQELAQKISNGVLYLPSQDVKVLLMAYYATKDQLTKREE